MKEFLAAINWGDAAVTLLAAFGGAWFAYLFNLKQQKKWDTQRTVCLKRAAATTRGGIIRPARGNATWAGGLIILWWTRLPFPVCSARIFWRMLRGRTIARFHWK